MESAVVNKIKILSETNKLVSNGLRKAAIDLLLEYLESDPNSSTVLSTLGRAYLLDHQPEKAVIYLKRSLEVIQSTNTANKIPSEYQSDDFDDDDMAYVESQSDSSSELGYRLEIDDHCQPTEKKGTPAPSKLRPLLRISRQNDDESRSHTNDKNIRITHRGKRISSSSNNEDSQNKQHELDLTQARKPITIPVHIDKIQIGISVTQHEVLKEQSPDKKRKIPLPTTFQSDGAAKESGIEGHSDSHRADDEEFELRENEELFTNELFEDDADTEGQDEEVLDELMPLSIVSSIDEEPDELIWDDLEEFDELAHRNSKEEALDDRRISREDRAIQIAVEVLDKTDLDKRYLSILKEIFSANGISSCRLAIERCIANGMSADELSLANEIRTYWRNSEYLWIDFMQVNKWAPVQFSSSRNRSLSWPVAHKIIKCFSGTPSFEEVLVFIENLYSDWYYDDFLRSYYASFYIFMLYRLGKLPKTLRGRIDLSFTNYQPEDEIFDDISLSRITENYIASAIQEEATTTAETINHRAISLANILNT